MNLTLTTYQMNIQFGQPQANLELVRQAAAEAAQRGSQMLLLPELWSTGYDLANAHRLAQINAEMLPQLHELACQHSTCIGGSLLLERDGKIYNTFVFHDPQSTQTVTYAKIHLFRLMDEDQWLAPGDHLELFSAPWGQTGLSICYDLRFPEMFRRYALDGARLFLIPAEWPAVRAAHWQTLLRARAIENQCFVAATNAVGPIGNEVFGGRSAVISPWGETIVESTSDQAEIQTVTIDLDLVAQARQRIPILQDRRPDLYG